MRSKTRLVSVRDFDQMLPRLDRWAVAWEIAHLTEAEWVRIRLELEYRRWLQAKALQALELPTSPPGPSAGPSAATAGAN